MYCPSCGAILYTGSDPLDIEQTVKRATREGLLADRYRIRKKLGQGGMGMVFLLGNGGFQ